MSTSGCARGGVFVNAEQVAGAVAGAAAGVYDGVWVRDCRAARGASEEELDARPRAHAATTAAPIRRRSARWLREAGFAHVDCVYKSWRFAVHGRVEGGRQ